MIIARFFGQLHTLAIVDKDIAINLGQFQVWYTFCQKTFVLHKECLTFREKSMKQLGQLQQNHWFLMEMCGFLKEFIEF